MKLSKSIQRNYTIWGLGIRFQKNFPFWPINKPDDWRDDKYFNNPYYKEHGWIRTVITLAWWDIEVVLRRVRTE